jgi:menaquinone-9 beta-reductase
MPTARTPGHAASTRRERHDVLVIGGGPAGSATAYWLAEAGWDVLVVEKKLFPREKTCGDGLTPRSVRQLEDMGLGDELSGRHRHEGLRAIGFGKELLLPWPAAPGFPTHGYVITRFELDEMVAGRAVKAGATLWNGHEAVAPLGGGTGPVPSENGTPPLCRGARVVEKSSGDEVEVEARCVVVADGANSRFGWALGTARDKSYPLGMAIRGYYPSPRHDEAWIESHLDVRDKDGNVVPGYGWIFPLGDGRVNVGVGLLSTFDQWKKVNTSHLMEAFLGWAPASWGLSPDAACKPPTGGRLPMSFSVGPRVGPDWLAVGDACASINPFNGEGIAYAYETGRLAASVVANALVAEDMSLLAEYERLTDERYALYYKVAGAFVQLIGNPRAMRTLAGTGMYSRTVMEWVLRVMSNLLRPDEIGPAEAAYEVVAALLDR